MKVVYARADKVPEDCDYITEGKLYLATYDRDLPAFLFWIICDNGDATLCHWDKDEHAVWQRLEYPYRDPQAVEALIEAARVLDLVEVGKALARLSPDAALGGEA